MNLLASWPLYGAPYIVSYVRDLFVGVNLSLERSQFLFFSSLFFLVCMTDGLWETCAYTSWSLMSTQGMCHWMGIGCIRKHLKANR